MFAEYAEAGALAPAHLWKLIDLLREVAIRANHEDAKDTKANPIILVFFGALGEYQGAPPNIRLSVLST